ncbi:MAG: hypothetical protein ABSG63_18285 [Spirochaetia bacterium]
MTSRERVRAALQHREPDRVPIDSNGIVSSMHETAYAALLLYLGREEKPLILDPVQRIVLASEEVLRELGVDTRYLYPEAPAGWKYQEDAEGCWRDEFGVTYKRVGFYARLHPLDPARPAGRGDRPVHGAASCRVSAGCRDGLDDRLWPGHHGGDRGPHRVLLGRR